MSYWLVEMLWIFWLDRKASLLLPKKSEFWSSGNQKHIKHHQTTLSNPKGLATEQASASSVTKDTSWLHSLDLVMAMCCPCCPCYTGISPTPRWWVGWWILMKVVSWWVRNPQKKPSLFGIIFLDVPTESPWLASNMACWTIHRISFDEFPDFIRTSIWSFREIWEPPNHHPNFHGIFRFSMK